MGKVTVGQFSHKTKESRDQLARQSWGEPRRCVVQCLSCLPFASVRWLPSPEYNPRIPRRRFLSVSVDVHSRHPLPTQPCVIVLLFFVCVCLYASTTNGVYTQCNSGLRRGQGKSVDDRESNIARMFKVFRRDHNENQTLRQMNGAKGIFTSTTETKIRWVRRVSRPTAWCCASSSGAPGKKRSRQLPIWWCTIFFLDFTEAHCLVVANAYFKKKNEHFITFTSESKRSQVDLWVPRHSDLMYSLDCKFTPRMCLTLLPRICVPLGHQWLHPAPNH